MAELGDVLAERLVLAGQLAERLGQAVADLDVPPGQRPGQLVLVIAGHGQGVTGRGHAHHQPEYAGRVGSPVDQVAQEQRGPAVWRHRVHRAPRPVPGDRVAELGEQGLQFGPAAVHVADHVERPGPVAVVVEQPFADHHGRAGLGGAAQDVDLAESLPAERAQGPAQLVVLAGNHLRPERAVRAARVALRAQAFRQVQHDRDGQHVVGAGQLHELLARGGLHVGRVHHRQPAGRQPLARDVGQHVERVGRRGLVVLVVGHQAAAEVAGEHLERPEVLPGEGGLARAGHADQDDQGQLGDVEFPPLRVSRAGHVRSHGVSVTGVSVTGISVTGIRHG